MENTAQGVAIEHRSTTRRAKVIGNGRRSTGSIFPVMLPQILIASALLLLGTMVAGSESAVDFTRDIKPLLDGRCISCHGAVKQKGGLRLDAGSLVLKGGTISPR